MAIRNGATASGSAEKKWVQNCEEEVAVGCVAPWRGGRGATMAGGGGDWYRSGGQCAYSNCEGWKKEKKRREKEKGENEREDWYGDCG